MDGLGAVVALIVGGMGATTLVALYVINRFDKRIDKIEENVAGKQNGDLSSIKEAIRKLTKSNTYMRGGITKLFKSHTHLKKQFDEIYNNGKAHRLGETKSRKEDRVS